MNILVICVTEGRTSFILGVEYDKDKAIETAKAFQKKVGGVWTHTGIGESWESGDAEIAISEHSLPEESPLRDIEREIITYREMNPLERFMERFIHARVVSHPKQATRLLMNYFRKGQD